MSNNNTPYVIYYNRVYVMSDWHNSQAADFYNIDHIQKSVELLAKMHIAGRGFNNLPEGIKPIKMKNLGDTYEKRYRETIKLGRKIESVGSRTDFEVLYLRNSAIYREFQEISKEFTNLIDYQKLMDQAVESQSIAHHKYTYHNIITTREEGTIITGFEKSGYDVQLVDLAYLIRRIMQRNRWDIDLLINIIEAYNKLIPLSQEEWRIMKGMIIYPEQFAKLCNQYYHSKRRWNYYMYYRKLAKILEYKDQYVECAREVMKW